MTDDVLADFPSRARDFLDSRYERIDLQLGVKTADASGATRMGTGFIDETGPTGLTSILRKTVDALVDAGVLPASVEKTQTAPVKMQGDNPT